MLILSHLFASSHRYAGISDIFHIRYKIQRSLLPQVCIFRPSLYLLQTQLSSTTLPEAEGCREEV